MSTSLNKGDADGTTSGATAAVGVGPTTAGSDFSIDTQTRTLSSVWGDYVAKIKGGELGSLPALLSIALLIAYFSVMRSKTFLTTFNAANLIQQGAWIVVIAMGITFVLLLGEIDLGAGFTAGVSAAVVALVLKEGFKLGPISLEPKGWVLLLLSLAVGAAVAALLGFFTGFLVARVGIPSFVVTLANFLSFQGILLLLAKEGGTIRITDEVIIAMANGNLSVAWSWAFCIIAIVVFAAAEFARRGRGNAGSSPIAVSIIRVVGVGALALMATSFFVQNRAISEKAKRLIGIPYAVPIVLGLLVVLTFLLTRTSFGRHLYAVGGNAEAARRAGISVLRIRIYAFVIAALVAGLGGLFIGSRLSSVSPQTGGNDTLILAVGAAVIGGTSLFGGKGNMVNALMGGIVIALIRNGLPLIGKTKLLGIWSVNFSEAGPQFIVAGLVLLASASVDALSRKRGG